MGGYSAEANVDQIKVYKKAFPGSKPQCLFCHVDKIPKKEVGQHDLNAYGTKVKETAAQITEETFKKVGAFEDFKEEGELTTEAAEAESPCDETDEGCAEGISEDK
jgi:hypothetical protein